MERYPDRDKPVSPVSSEIGGSEIGRKGSKHGVFLVMDYCREFSRRATTYTDETCSLCKG